MFEEVVVLYVQLDIFVGTRGRKGAIWKYGRCCDVRLVCREMGEGGLHVERQRQKSAACRACVCGVVCARSLRGAVVTLDLCPFGGRKFACAGRAGDVGAGRVLRGGKEKKWKNKVRNEGRTAAGLKTYLNNVSGTFPF